MEIPDLRGNMATDWEALYPEPGPRPSGPGGEHPMGTGGPKRMGRTRRWWPAWTWIRTWPTTWTGTSPSGTGEGRAAWPALATALAVLLLDQALKGALLAGWVPPARLDPGLAVVVASIRARPEGCSPARPLRQGAASLVGAGVLLVLGSSPTSPRHGLAVGLVAGGALANGLDRLRLWGRGRLAGAGGSACLESGRSGPRGRGSPGGGGRVARRHDEEGTKGLRPEARPLGLPAGGRRRVWQVRPEEAGLRLDQFLARREPQRSRAFWQKRIEAGDVRVNGQVAPRRPS